MALLVIQGYKFKERTDISGQADHNVLEIRISDVDGSSNLLAQDRIEEIFIHEILHCIDNAYNAGKLDDDTICRFSEGLNQVLKDNKLLV